jgi:hypothetical protein
MNDLCPNPLVTIITLPVKPFQPAVSLDDQAHLETVAVPVAATREDRNGQIPGRLFQSTSQEICDL